MRANENFDWAGMTHAGQEQELGQAADSMVSSHGLVPWHEHANARTVAGALTAVDALRLGGLDWIVQKCTLYAANRMADQYRNATVRDLALEGKIREDMTLQDINDALKVWTPFGNHMGTFRDVQDPDGTARRVDYAPVGEGYEIVQNFEALAIADSLAGEGGMEFHTAGSLFGGRVVYLSGKMPKAVVVRDDCLDCWFIIRTSHDGTSSVMIFFGTTRPVCQNTLNASVKGARAMIKAQHTKNVRENIERRVTASVGGILKASDGYWDRYAAVLNKMADATVTDDFVCEVIKAAFPAKDEEKVSTRTKNARADARDICYGGQFGGDMDAIRRGGLLTGYGLYQGLTQWVQYKKGTTDRGKRDLSEARWDSVVFGSGARFRQKVLDTITEKMNIDARALPVGT